MTARRAGMRIATWTILGVAGLLAWACTSDEPSSTSARSRTTDLQRATAPIPVDPATAQGPGTPLGNGFTVADGSVLLAGPLPAAVGLIYEGEPVPVEGWAAHLVIAGDPRPVMDAYRSQAEAAGFEVTSADDVAISQSPATPICRVEYGEQICAIAGYDRSDPDRRFSAFFVRRPANGRVPATSSLDLAYRVEPIPDREEFDPIPERSPPNPLGTSIAPVATDWPPLPAAGDPFAEGYEASGIEPFLLEAGSRLAGAPGPSDCTNEAYRAILTIDGDAQDLFEAYTAQADRHSGGLAGEIARTQATDRGLITTYLAGGGGADSYALLLYDLDDASPVLVIETCTD